MAPNWRYCGNCGKIEPGADHPLGGCSCGRPDFSGRRTLEARLATLQADLEGEIGLLRKLGERYRHAPGERARGVAATRREDADNLTRILQRSKGEL